MICNNCRNWDENTKAVYISEMIGICEKCRDEWFVGKNGLTNWSEEKRKNPGNLEEYKRRVREAFGLAK
jgi:hypothetical protein